MFARSQRSERVVPGPLLGLISEVMALGLGLHWMQPLETQVKPPAFPIFLAGGSTLLFHWNDQRRQKYVVLISPPCGRFRVAVWELQVLLFGSQHGSLLGRYLTLHGLDLDRLPRPMVLHCPSSVVHDDDVYTKSGHEDVSSPGCKCGSGGNVVTRH